MAKRLELLTPAKINLFLRVVGRRPDGYHELDSLFLPISLFDRIVIETTAAATSAVALRCNWPEMPRDARNLAVKAAQLFIAQAGLRVRVDIDLHKEIPAGAGLGGGSSDAAAVLRALASMHPTGPAELAALALTIGADVPFFLDPRPARIGGVGERITYLEGDFTWHLTIGVPPVAVSTAEIYRNLERRQWSGPAPAMLPKPLVGHPIAGELLVNDLQAVAVARYPQVGAIKAILEDLGAFGVAMSGSGGAVFGLFHNAGEAQRAADAAAAAMPSARFLAVHILGTGCA